MGGIFWPPLGIRPVGIEQTFEGKDLFLYDVGLADDLNLSPRVLFILSPPQLKCA